MGDSRADGLQEQRTVFLSLLGATLPAEEARQTLQHRIETKLAHASLLTRATFGEDKLHAETAKTVARGYVSACQNLLLDS